VVGQTKITNKTRNSICQREQKKIAAQIQHLFMPRINIHLIKPCSKVADLSAIQ